MTRAMEQLEEAFSSRPMPSRLRARRWLMGVALLSLAACGGGGGFKTNDSLTVTPQAVSVSATLSDPAPNATIYIAATGLNPGQTVYIFGKPTTLGIAKIVQTSGSELPLVANIQFQSPFFMGVGTYNDTILISVCFDQACSQPLNGSPYTLPVQYTVTKSQLPPLAIDTISPTNVVVGGPSFTLTVLGKGFSTYAYVQWNGVKLPTTNVSATELLAQVPAADISATGTATVTVSDPTNSHATTSSPQSIAIAAASKDAVAFQNNAAHTGAVTFANLSFPSSKTWSVDVGGTPSYAIVAQGKVVLTVTTAYNTSQILALDQATGNTVWGPIALAGDSNAAYDAGRVYVLIENVAGATGTLQAYDLNTGALDWSTNLSGQFSLTAGPTAAYGMVYAIGNGNGSELIGVDGSTGAVEWTRFAGANNSTPAVSADGVYVAAPCEADDIRPATGELIWQMTVGCSGGIGGETPVVANQSLYAPTEGSGYDGDVFNAESGASVSTYTADSPPAFTSTFGYYLKSGVLSGVTLAGNKQQWTFTGDGHLQGAPLAVDQYVFIGSSLGNVYAVDSATGLQAWSVNLGAAIDTAVQSLPLTGFAAGDGLLIVPAGTKVFAYTLSTNP